MAKQKKLSPEPKPCGSWKSEITSDMVVEGVVSFKDTTVDGDNIYWVESRPDEDGRYVVVRYSPDGKINDITPPGFSARTIIYSYGGGSFAVSNGTVYFSNYDPVNNPKTLDQRIFKQAPAMRPQPITSPSPVFMRYGDGVIDKKRNRMICVKEDYTVLVGGYPVVSIVGIDLDGEKQDEVLVSGNDFYSSPCLSPDGNRLAYLTWNFPYMPWDSNELWIANIDKDGSLKDKQKVAGDTSKLEPGEAIGQKIAEHTCERVSKDFLYTPQALFQPQWSPDGKYIYFVSDLDNWWNIYRCEPGKKDISAEMITIKAPGKSEFGAPQWILGMSTYAFLSKDEIIAAYTRSGEWHLAIIHTDKKDFNRIKVELAGIEGVKSEATDINHVRTTSSGTAVFIAGSYNHPSSIVSFDAKSGQSKVLRSSMKDMTKILKIKDYISKSSFVEYPTGTGMKDNSYAFYYYPENPGYNVPADEKPPLLLVAHGGPTGAVSTSLSLILQYFTSRGFSAADVNYRGSTGFGRKYRLSLYSQWGIYDRDDCVNCAKYLSQHKKPIDIDRVLTRGGSAGGYLTIVLATYTDLCKAGASYYGISNLVTLVEHTHKFESRYLIELVGPYPEERKTYMLRSPIYVLDLVDTPLIFFQGAQDPVVPPEQSKKMVEAIKDKGKPVAYIEYANEQHGFLMAKDIKGSLEAEFYFYSRMLNFEPADKLAPVDIYNWPAKET
ncbi:MAG: S9 family peptidase [Candidatus Aminicenantes bacterium]|nr:MAG: S9 family peptidase [Candidatus Aminicenantes bacterium]